MSCTSGPTLVKPHAIDALWPMTMPGSPGVVTPATRTPGALRCIMYQIEGADAGRCGSLASSGLPDAVREPATTQLLLAARFSLSRPTRSSESARVSLIAESD